MTRSNAKSIVLPKLRAMVAKGPVFGYLADCGGERVFFQTMQAAVAWIAAKPDYLKDVNEMPMVHTGWFKNVVLGDT